MNLPFGKGIKLPGWIVTAIMFLSAVALFCFFVAGESGTVPPREHIESVPVDHTGKTYAGKTMVIKDHLTLEDRLVEELQKFYGKTISGKSTQVLLLKIKNFLSGLYPTDGDLRFYAILRRAFPDLADEIMETITKMEQYTAWLDENERMISELNDLEKQGLLQEKRRELFGEDADVIWSEEVLAYEQRKQDMKDTLRMLDDSYDTPLDQKLHMYKTSLSKAYEGSPEAYILDNTDMLARVFFSIDSVAEELSLLDPDQRRIEITRIRKEMGYTQEQIKKLEEMDAYRDARWENGLSYMKERELITREYEGQQLDDQLKALREKYFKHEAKTIELEEKDGFFRYTRKRYYGRN